MVATENKAINPDLEQYGKAGRKLNGGNRQRPRGYPVAPIQVAQFIE